MQWWQRFRPNRAALPAAVLATALTALSLLLIWSGQGRMQQEMDRFGIKLAGSLAHSNAGELLDARRINLAVIANRVAAEPEVAGISFFNSANELVAMSGSQQREYRYSAAATLNNTLTGYVYIVLEPRAFAIEMPWARWLLSILAVLATPLLTLVLIQLGTQGNRSLPIVSVPSEPEREEPAYLLVVNLYNQPTLGKESLRRALQDAINMGQEVCALHPGMPIQLRDRGVALLLTRDQIGAANVFRAALLLQRLLTEYETEGNFRFYLSTTRSPGDPSEITNLDYAYLEEQVDLDNALTLASLSGNERILLSQQVFSELSPDQQAWCAPFEHPIIEDIAPEATCFNTVSLDPDESQRIGEQARMILGFNLQDA